MELYHEEIKEVKNKKDGFWIRVDKKAEKRIKERFLDLFIRGEEKYLNFLDKNDIISILSNIIEAEEVLDILKLEKKLEIKYGINVKEILKEAIKKEEFRYLFLGNLLAIFEKLNLHIEEANKILEEKLEKENEDKLFSLLEDIKKLVKEERYKEVGIKKMNEKIDIILGFLSNNWEDFEKGRGFVFNDVKFVLLTLNDFKNYLTDKNKNKIKEFLLANNIEKIIKRRVKNEKHQNYLKVILDFLPPEIANKYLAYLVVNEL